MFDLSHGGNDTVHGGGGNDLFVMGAAFTAADIIDGGSGNDTLEIDLHNGSHTTTFAANTMTNVETLKLDSTTTLILSDGNVAAGQILTVWDASTVGGNAVDGSAETDGSFHFIGEQTNSSDSFKGGAGNDLFDMGDNSSPVNTLHGNGGDDIFSFNAHFSSINSLISGGTGSDTLELNGDYTTLAIRADTGHILSVETLKFLGGHSYTGISITGDMAGGSTLTIDAIAASNLSINLSAATSASYAITGSGGDDTITFGSNFSTSDTIDGGAGTDTVTLNWNNSTANLTFTQTTISNVENLVFNDGGTSNFVIITTADGNVAGGATLTVDFSGSDSVGADFTFNGSAEQDGHFHIIGPASVNYYTVTGGALSDTFTLGDDGTPHNSVQGGGGDDTLTMTTAGVAVQFDGGTDNDTLALTGGGTVFTNQFGLTSVENLTLDDHTWNITTGGSMVDSGATLSIDASALTASHSLAFNGAGETDGSFVFEFAGNFTASDSLTGGAVADTLELNGDYSLAFGASTMASIETIMVAAGHNYNLSTNDANVAAGATLTVDASALTSSFSLNFGGGAETNGHFAFIAGAGTDVLEGGSQSDTFDLSLTTTANAFGGGGNDTFTVTSAAMIANGLIDAGTGSDTLILNAGDFSTATAITASTVVNIETLQLLGAANSYNLTIAGGGVTGAGTFTVDASAAAQLTLDLSGIANAAVVTGSAGNDSIVTSNHGSTITGGLGADSITCGTGADTIVTSAVAESHRRRAAYDTIDAVQLLDTDKFDLAGAHTVTNIHGTSAFVDSTTFDANLTAASVGHLSDDGVLIVSATTGNLSGHIFIIVDVNNDGLYQAGADYVFDVSTAFGTIDTGDFI